MFESITLNSNRLDIGNSIICMTHYKIDFMSTGFIEFKDKNEKKKPLTAAILGMSDTKLNGKQKIVYYLVNVSRPEFTYEMIQIVNEGYSDIQWKNLFTNEIEANWEGKHIDSTIEENSLFYELTFSPSHENTSKLEMLDVKVESNICKNKADLSEYYSYENFSLNKLIFNFKLLSQDVIGYSEDGEKVLHMRPGMNFFNGDKWMFVPNFSSGDRNGAACFMSKIYSEFGQTKVAVIMTLNDQAYLLNCRSDVKI